MKANILTAYLKKIGSQINPEVTVEVDGESREIASSFVARTDGSVSILLKASAKVKPVVVEEAIVEKKEEVKKEAPKVDPKKKK
jgi:antitoxin component of MazEF toxin-antitoxin module